MPYGGAEDSLYYLTLKLTITQNFGELSFPDIPYDSRRHLDRKPVINSVAQKVCEWSDLRQ